MLKHVKRNQIIITALVVMIAAAGYLNYIDQRPENAGEVVFMDEEGDMGALVPNEGLTEIDAVMTEAEGETLAEGEVMTEGGLITADGTAAQEVMAEDRPLAEGDVMTDPEIDIAMTYEDEAEEILIAESGELGDEDLGAAVFVNASGDSPYFIQAKLDREQAVAKQKEILTGMINNPNLEQASKAQCADEMLKIQDRIAKESAAEALIKSKGISDVYVRIDDESVDVVVGKEVLSDAEIAQIEDIVKRKTGMSADKIRINTLKK